MILFEGQKMQGNEQKKGQKAKACGHIIQEKSHRKKNWYRKIAPLKIYHILLHILPWGNAPQKNTSKGPSRECIYSTCCTLNYF